MNGYQPSGHTGIDYPPLSIAENVLEATYGKEFVEEMKRAMRDVDHGDALLEDAIRDGLKSEGLEVVETLMGGAL